MKEPEMQSMAKEAYVLAQQLQELETSLGQAEGVSGYHAYARNYNAMLARAKEVLQHDDIIAQSMSHLCQYDETKQQGVSVEFNELKADIPILRAALSSFFAFHFPKKEKDKMGFTS